MGSIKDKLLVSIVGPTAIGKTAVAILLAQKFNTEIISADSRQLYKEMNIGTAKPSKKELQTIQHHFINSLSIQEDFNVFDFERQALEKIEREYLYSASQTYKTQADIAASLGTSQPSVARLLKKHGLRIQSG